jgi:hypothetical protein
MRNQVWLLLLIVGLSYGLPRPQDEEEDAEDAAEDEEYDVYDAVGDAAEGKLCKTIFTLVVYQILCLFL